MPIDESIAQENDENHRPGLMSPREPVFVIGNPRSGTTLLRLMLTCHPAICIPPEAGFALWLEPDYADWQRNDSRLPAFIQALFGSRKFETWELDRDSLAEDILRKAPASYAALVDCIYTHYASRHKPGWKLWGDKNNFYLAHITRIHRLFPGARFVHIIRDPRDVACSYLELRDSNDGSDYRPRLPVEIGQIAEEWRENIKRIESGLAAVTGNQTHCLRFEDLVSQPADTLIALCEFLGESFDPLMLNYHEENAAFQLEPPDFLSWKRLTLSPPQTSRVGRFREDLDMASARLVVSLTEPVFSRYYGDQA